MVRESFAAQAFMRTLGATLETVEPGRVVIGFGYDASLTQQDGFVHAGALASVADSACGYAAMSSMGAGDRVLSIEFKINMLKPAVGERFVAEGRVVRAGRTITVCEAGVYAVSGDERVRVAQMQGTMMRLRDEGTVG